MRAHTRTYAYVWGGSICVRRMCVRTVKVAACRRMGIRPTGAGAVCTHSRICVVWCGVVHDADARITGNSTRAQGFINIFLFGGVCSGGPGDG